MDRRDQVADLHRAWRHASQVAFASIGQPDRAENVAYRDELMERLRTAVAEADAEADITGRTVYGQGKAVECPQCPGVITCSRCNIVRHAGGGGVSG